MGGTMASWLIHSSLDRVVLVRALVADIVLCSWTRHFTLTVPLSTLSTQVYKWLPEILMLGGGGRGEGGGPCDGQVSHPEWSRNTTYCLALQKPGIQAGLMDQAEFTLIFRPLPSPLSNVIITWQHRKACFTIECKLSSIYSTEHSCESLANSRVG